MYLTNSLSKEEINKLLGDAWLNLKVEESQLYNPLLEIPEFCSDNPHLYISWLLSQPDYFSFTCSQLLNIDIFPLQGLILKELWNHRFPILVGSRGLAKSSTLAIYSLLRMVLFPGRKIIIAGAAFRQSKIIFEYMENIWNNAPLLRDMCSGFKDQGPIHGTDLWTFKIGDSITKAIPIGCLSKDTLVTTNDGIKYIKDLQQNLSDVWSNNKFKKIGFFYNCPKTKTIKISTKYKYDFTGTANHKMKVCRDGKINWVRTDEMKIGDKILIDRTERWHNNDDSSYSIDDAYCLGLMIGDGSFVNKYYLRYTTIDKEFISILNKTIGVFRPQKDRIHYQFNNKIEVQNWLNKWHLTHLYTHQKYLTDKILSLSKDKMTACLQGLYDTDGTINVTHADNSCGIAVVFTNTSYQLIKQIQYILLHYGIISTIYFRDRQNKLTQKQCKRCYDLVIRGHNIKIFADKIGFRLQRKQNKLLNAIQSKKRFVDIDDYVPFVKDLWFKKHIPSIVKGKTQLTYNKLLQIDNSSLPIDIQLLCNPNYFYDTIIDINEAEDQLMYDINVPEDNEYCANGFMSHNSGDKIRGQRSNDTISDEFSAIPRDIFETVIGGFAAVSASPLDNMKKMARERLAKILKIKLYNEEEDESAVKDNQMILSGTAYYDFNHFADYWKKWHSFICSQGDIKAIERIFGKDKIPKSFDWKDYSILRIPFELIPEGFMDEAQVARSRASIHSGIYANEYGAVFSKDSNGFFKRTLIEKCTASPDNNIIIPDVGKVSFNATIKGDKGRRYILAVDPASEIDNFAIIILELWNNHRRIVYSWTTNKQDYKERVKSELTKDGDYYSFCSRKIRQLLKEFPCAAIAIDSEGGGRFIVECLQNTKLMEDDDEPLYPVIDYTDPKDTDNKYGQHIIHLIKFADSEWTSKANHDLRGAFESKTCLFPYNDAVDIALAISESELSNSIYDTLEDCIFEIEELKNELSTIIITQTPNGRDKWDTPEIKLPGSKKGRMRKDRYSALLMAHAVSLIVQNTSKESSYTTELGWAERMLPNQMGSGKTFIGPQKLADALNNLYD